MDKNLENNIADEETGEDVELSDSEELRALITDAMDEEPAVDEADEETPSSIEAKGEEEPAVDNKIGKEAPEPDATSDDAAKLDAAPLDWTPALREKWKDLDPAVKKQVMDRDKHVNQMLQDGAQSRKTGESLNGLAQSYKAILDAEGVSDPMQAVEGLFKTVGTLRMGSPQDKANTIAKMIQVYGVDINTLDAAIVGGQETAAPAVDPTIQKMINDQMAPVNQLLNNMTLQQDNNVQTEVQTFAGANEFYEDVKMTMADFLEVAAKNGQKMTMEDAYNRSCAINPEISKVKADRAMQENLLGNSSLMETKKRAASSVRSNGADPTAVLLDDSIRGSLTDAIELHR